MNYPGTLMPIPNVPPLASLAFPPCVVAETNEAREAGTPAGAIRPTKRRTVHTSPLWGKFQIPGEPEWRKETTIGYHFQSYRHGFLSVAAPDPDARVHRAIPAGHDMTCNTVKACREMARAAGLRPLNQWGSRIALEIERRRLIQRIRAGGSLNQSHTPRRALILAGVEACNERNRAFTFRAGAPGEPARVEACGNTGTRFRRGARASAVVVVPPRVLEFAAMYKRSRNVFVRPTAHGVAQFAFQRVDSEGRALPFGLPSDHCGSEEWGSIGFHRVWWLSSTIPGRARVVEGYSATLAPVGSSRLETYHAEPRPGETIAATLARAERCLRRREGIDAKPGKPGPSPWECAVAFGGLERAGMLERLNVRRGDSIRAGNCGAGTRAWCESEGIGGTETAIPLERLTRLYRVAVARSSPDALLVARVAREAVARQWKTVKRLLAPAKPRRHPTKSKQEGTTANA